MTNLEDENLVFPANKHIFYLAADVAVILCEETSKLHLCLITLYLLWCLLYSITFAGAKMNLDNQHKIFENFCHLAKNKNFWRWGFLIYRLF